MPTHRTIVALTLPCAALLTLGAAQQRAIDPAWLTFDATARTARFQLIAGLTGLNGALNFNGFRDGGLSFVVPLGWKTEIDFRNHDGMLPHSAEVIAPRTPLPVEPVDPAIPRAFPLRLAAGLPVESSFACLWCSFCVFVFLSFCSVLCYVSSFLCICLFFFFFLY